MTYQPDGAAAPLLDEHHLANEVVVVEDGEEALDYLFRRSKYADRPEGNPAVVLLDLKMPKVHGFELLLYLKRSRLIVIPTIVFTMSDDKDDIKKAFMLGANAFQRDALVRQRARDS